MSLALLNLQTPTLRARSGVPAWNHASAGASDENHAVGMGFAGVNSTDLLRGRKAVEIMHNGLTYRLQATRLGKLILTK